MNGFLLIAACNLDDVPVQFYATKAQAFRSAKARKGPPKSNPLGAWDKSGFVCWKVLEFRKGKPINVWIPEDYWKKKKGAA